MEMELKKENFLESITRLKNIENRKQAARTEGFLYLHNMITKRLAEGQGFIVGDIDFSLFTEDDLIAYMEYYSKTLEPKIKMVSEFFDVLKRAGTVFSEGRRYY